LLHLLRAGGTLIVAASMLIGVAACGLFQPALSLEAAVARLLPNDPPVAQFSDRIIGDDEIVLAVQFWIRDLPVPRSGGQRINDDEMKRLIELWASGGVVAP